MLMNELCRQCDAIRATETRNEGTGTNTAGQVPQGRGPAAAASRRPSLRLTTAANASADGGMSAMLTALEMKLETARVAATAGEAVLAVVRWCQQRRYLQQRRYHPYLGGIHIAKVEEAAHERERAAEAWVQRYTRGQTSTARA